MNEENDLEYGVQLKTKMEAKKMMKKKIQHVKTEEGLRENY